MKDYNDLGLDSNLRKADSLSSRERTFNDSYGFGVSSDVGMIGKRMLGTAIIQTAHIQDASITNAKIDSIQWDKAQGGTLILGGTNNTSGVFSLQDEGGTEKISMDKDGMTINDGNLTLKDSGGTTIVDAGGLVSAANFGVQTTIITGTTTQWAENGYIPVPGGTITLSRTRTTVYLIGLTANCRNTSAGIGDSVLFDFTIGGGTVGPAILQAGHVGTTSTVTNQAASGSFIVSLAAGTSNLILQWATSGAGTAIISSFSPNQLYAIKLGN